MASNPDSERAGSSSIGGPKTLLEAIDPKLLGNMLRYHVRASEDSLRALEKALFEGPGKWADDPRILEDYSVDDVDAPANSTPAMKCFLRVHTAIGHGLTVLHRVMDDAYIESAGITGFLALLVPSDVIERLPQGTMTPFKHAELQVEAFLAFQPFVRRLVFMCTEDSVLRLWNADELPKLIKDTNPEPVPGRRPYAWTLLSNVVTQAMKLCISIMYPLLSNRWIRRRLAEDPELTIRLVKANLLDRNRLEALHGGSRGLKYFALLLKTATVDLSLSVYPILENSESIRRFSDEIGIPFKWSPMEGDENGAWNDDNPLVKFASQSTRLTLLHLIQKSRSSRKLHSTYAGIISTIRMKLHGQSIATANAEIGELHRYLLAKTFDATVGVDCCDYCALPRSSPKDLKRCSRCKIAKYCGETCQRAHWKEHKKMCIEKKYQIM